MSEAASVTSRVWRTLLTLLPSSAGPIAIQHAPLTARSELGSLREPFSSIQYPTGTRAHLIDAVGQQLEPLPPLGDAASTFDGHRELAQLNDDIVRFRELPMIRKAEVLSCLNCMTEQRVALRLVPALSWSEHYADPDGCCVLYEAARSLIRVKPKDQQSRRVLERLSRQDVNPRMATAAAIQLGAASVRLDQDLDAAAQALDVADQRRAEVDSSFVADLLDSRYYRALALLALKRRDFALLRSSMDNTMTAAVALMARTTPTDEYPLLVARENMRLVVEVHLVAATGAEKPDQFSLWARRLLDLDPEDPFTWQYLSIYGARCGCVVEAALAVSGVAIIGGLDYVGVSEALGAARVGDFRDTDLLEKILATLESLVRPEKTAELAQPTSAA